MLPEEYLHPSKIIEILQRSELWISELYKICSEVYKEDKDFWEILEKDEIKHFENLKLISQLYNDHPQNFETARQIREIAVQSMIESVKLVLPELKAGKIPRKRMLAIARNIEESIIESKYQEIFNSKDYKFLALIKEIAVETYKHKKLLYEKMSLVSKEE